MSLHKPGDEYSRTVFLLAAVFVCFLEKVHHRILEYCKYVNDPPPLHTLRGGGFVPLMRTQGIHMPAAPFDRDYVCTPD